METDDKEIIKKSPDNTSLGKSALEGLKDFLNTYAREAIRERRADREVNNKIKLKKAGFNSDNEIEPKQGLDTTPKSVLNNIGLKQIGYGVAGVAAFLLLMKLANR